MAAQGQGHSIPFSFSPSFTWGVLVGAPRSLTLQMNRVLGSALGRHIQGPSYWSVGAKGSNLCLQWGSGCNKSQDLLIYRKEK